MCLLLSSMKVFIRAQISRGARVTFSEKQLCNAMLSDSNGARRFCSSSGYFQKKSVLSATRNNTDAITMISSAISLESRIYL